jgi:NAD(P)-dependent dehydrogenase (short-subunit alcohol dehydrogenase family)
MQNPFSAALSGALGTRAGAEQSVALRPEERADGKHALVTGANRGLGKAVAIQLAERGAKLLLACRSGIPEAGAQIARASCSRSVEMRPLDLADLHSVETFCRELARDQRQVDLLVLNAGVVPNGARRTQQGFELMFGVNYLANVMLVERLLELGVLAPNLARPPRIVFVSSETHRDVGPVDFARLGRFETYTAMGSMQVYGYSKLLLEVYAAQLARRLGDRAGVHSLCPGAVDTDIAREAPDWVKPTLSTVMKLFFRAPEEAAKPVLYLCCARKLEGRTGRYLHGTIEKKPTALTRDSWTGQRLVRDSQALIARAMGGAR